MADSFTENEEVKEVYAYFGLAVYTAQCLEHGLVNAFTLFDFIPSKKSTLSLEEWEREIDFFTSKYFEYTLGRMIENLKKITDVPTDLSDKLSEALKIRNWLTHSYFRERAGDFLFSRGRKNMIEELKRSICTIKEADNQLSKILVPVFRKYGITEEFLAKTSEEMLSKVKKDKNF